MEHAQAGIFLLTAALTNSTEETNQTEVVKTKSANNVYNINLKATQFWQGKLEHCKSEDFSKLSTLANEDLAIIQTTSNAEMGVVGAIPQQLAAKLRACSDIIGLLSFTAQLMTSQS